MKKQLQYWYIPLLRGIAFIILALYCIFTPIVSILVLTAFIGWMVIAAGVFFIFEVIANWKEMENKGWILARGFIDIIFGWIILSNTITSSIIFVVVYGIWAMVAGVMLIIASFDIKKAGDSYWWLGIFAGLISIVLGWYIISFPLISVVALAWLLGFQLLSIGIFEIMLAFRIRKVHVIVA